MMAFSWDREGQVNELEMATVVALLKHRANLFRCRWFL